MVYKLCNLRRDMHAQNIPRDSSLAALLQHKIRLLAPFIIAARAAVLEYAVAHDESRQD